MGDKGSASSVGLKQEVGQTFVLAQWRFQNPELASIE